MSDFAKGALLWLIGAATFCGILTSAAPLFTSTSVTTRACRTAKRGYTWGECYSVIVGDQNTFTK
jgi:hypothetical protein